MVSLFNFLAWAIFLKKGGRVVYKYILVPLSSSKFAELKIIGMTPRITTNMSKRIFFFAIIGFLRIPRAL